MSKIMREAIAKKKDYYIQKLLNLGVYNPADSSVYKLTLSELQNEYRNNLEKRRIH